MHEENITLGELLADNKYSEAREMLREMNVVDIAEAFEEIDEVTAVRMFRMLPKDDAAEVFAYLSGDAQQKIVAKIKDEEIKYIIEEMYLDDAVDFIEEMPANVVKRVLSSIPADRRELINQFLKYPENSAGSIMTIEYISLKEHLTVSEAFDRIRTQGIDSETIYTCYVTDTSRRLTGAVSVKTLLLAPPNAIVGDIMERTIISAVTTDDQEQLANNFRKYGLLAMPVVDNESRIVGIVTVDDVMTIQEEEATEDFEIMAAMSPSEEPYMKTGVWTLVKNRLPWLMLLMLTAMLTGGIIASFEESLIVIPALMTFIPMLMDTGGNSGSQSSTLIIRGMAINEVATSDLLRAWWKEIRVAAICGGVLAIVNFVRILIFNMDRTLEKAAAFEKAASLGIVVSVSLFCTVILAKSLGVLLPIAAKKLKLDPAVMASPIITTIVDAGALVVLFGLSKAIFNI